MAEKRNDAERIGSRAQDDLDKGGILPEGIRGTTRDVGYTQPADEHEGYKDPTKPELRKPAM